MPWQRVVTVPPIHQVAPWSYIKIKTVLWLMNFDLVGLKMDNGAGTFIWVTCDYFLFQYLFVICCLLQVLMRAIPSPEDKQVQKDVQNLCTCMDINIVYMYILLEVIQSYRISTWFVKCNPFLPKIILIQPFLSKTLFKQSS